MRRAFSAWVGSTGGCATALMANTDIPTATAVPMINCVMLLFRMIASHACDCRRLPEARLLACDGSHRGTTIPEARGGETSRKNSPARAGGESRASVPPRPRCRRPAEQRDELAASYPIIPGRSRTTVVRAQLEAFRQGLKEYGWIEGQNISIEYRFADGKEDAFAEIAAELVQLRLDDIVAEGTAAIRAAPPPLQIPAVRRHHNLGTLFWLP